jgi:hypothetical protein
VATNWLVQLMTAITRFSAHPDQSKFDELEEAGTADEVRRQIHGVATVSMPARMQEPNSRQLERRACALDSRLPAENHVRLVWRHV